MLKNNCRCDLCRSVWGVGGCEEPDELTRGEAAILAAVASTAYPSVSTFSKSEVEARYENH